MALSQTPFLRAAVYVSNFFLISFFLITTSYAKDKDKNLDEVKIHFKKGTLKINKKELKIEIAETPSQHAYGLMNRSSLPDNQGMLFVFEEEDFRSFWMKNTFIDLSIAYIDKNRKIIEILDMKAVSSSLDVNLPSYPSHGKAKYALEVSQGWFKKNNIKVGNFISEYKILK